MMRARGVSIIAAVMALLILSIFGATIVLLVATDQEMRTMHLSKERAFYAVQAGLEYANREVKEGGYPVVTNKSIGSGGTFTTTVTYMGHIIRATGRYYNGEKTHQMTVSALASDCASIDTGFVIWGGGGYTDLLGLRILKMCFNGISMDKILLSWVPDGGQRVTRIMMDNATIIYDGAPGSVSGTMIDTSDVRISDAAVHKITPIRFNSDMRGKQITLQVYFTDTSYTMPVTFTPPS